MGCRGYRASGFSVRDKFMTDPMQAELLDVRVWRFIEHDVEGAMQRPVRSRGRARDLFDRQRLI